MKDIPEVEKAKKVLEAFRLMPVSDVLLHMAKTMEQSREARRLSPSLKDFWNRRTARKMEAVCSDALTSCIAHVVACSDVAESSKEVATVGFYVQKLIVAAARKQVEEERKEGAEPKKGKSSFDGDYPVVGGAYICCGTCSEWAGRPETRRTKCPHSCSMAMTEMNWCPGWSGKDGRTYQQLLKEARG